MADHIPPVSALKARLSDLSHAQVTELARLSGVPFGTLWKIRTGETGNPGMETVRKFWPMLPDRRREARA